MFTGMTSGRLPIIRSIPGNRASCSRAQLDQVDDHDPDYSEDSDEDDQIDEVMDMI